MIDGLFHRWERHLASVSDTKRVVRPFDWGLDWLPLGPALDGAPDASGTPASAAAQNGAGQDGRNPEETLRRWIEAAMRDTDRFFTPPPTRDYTFTPATADRRERGEAGTLTFPSAVTTPHPENNLVRARFFPAKPVRKARPGTVAPRRAVVVMAQWNAEGEGHIGLCRMLARLGVSALRISLPYHDLRMPPELTRADYIVSSNVGRTLQVCRQAVLDVRRALWWLRDQGHDRLGLLGTSLGSCLAMLTGCHEPLVRTWALNHVSPHFGDVVWRGLSTEHVRRGLDGHIDLPTLRDLWRPISPWSYLDRLPGPKTLLVYAKYDLTFPVDLSRTLVAEWRRRDPSVRVAVLPCGHYTTGRAPFKFLDGYYLGSFLAREL